MEAGCVNLKVTMAALNARDFYEKMGCVGDFSTIHGQGFTPAEQEELAHLLFLSLAGFVRARDASADSVKKKWKMSGFQRGT